MSERERERERDNENEKCKNLEKHRRDGGPGWGLFRPQFLRI
jgi:hypothetical protein